MHIYWALHKHMDYLHYTILITYYTPHSTGSRTVSQFRFLNSLKVISIWAPFCFWQKTSLSEIVTSKLVLLTNSYQTNICQRPGAAICHLLEWKVWIQYIVRYLAMVILLGYPHKTRIIIISIVSFSQPFKDRLIVIPFRQPFKDFLIIRLALFCQPLKENAILVLGQALGHSVKCGLLRVSSRLLQATTSFSAVEKESLRKNSELCLSTSKVLPCRESKQAFLSWYLSLVPRSGLHNWLVLSKIAHSCLNLWKH